jgi:hypothetical protein
MTEKTTMAFYKWVYKDKEGQLLVTPIYYNEEGISPYGLKLVDKGTPVQKLDSQCVKLDNWKIKET